MQIDLSGKEALVTGSTAGIGFAIARGLAAAGAAVTLSGRTRERVDAAIAALEGEVEGAAVRGIAADAGSPEGIEAILAEVQATDILVNSLGIFEPKEFFAITDEDWRRFFEVNVLSGVRLARALAPGMRERGWGRILFISSESGLHIPPEMIHYGVTKTALIALARGLAETLAGSGVTVNSVLPGPTRSEGVTRFVKELAAEQNKSEAEMETEFFTSMRPTSLIRRFAEVEEVANMVVYLASKEASATTGSAVRVDGGVVRAIP